MRRRRHQGFTLLEMLVAISVFGLLVSMVYGMLRLGSRGWEAGDERIDQTDTMRIGWTFLQRALNNARDTKNQNEDEKGVHFFGTDKELEFVADMPAYLGTGGLHVVSLSIMDAVLDKDQEGPEQKLVLQRVPLLEYDTELSDDQIQRAVLVDQVDSLKIDYYGTPGDGGVSRKDDAPEWHDEWKEASTLPVLVRIAVHPYGRDPWPILVAHPQLGSGRKASVGPEDMQETGMDDGDGPGEPGGEASNPDRQNDADTGD